MADPIIVNPETIKYDSTTKRFWNKGLVPKAIWGGVTSVVAAAGIAAVVVATGGLALGVGAAVVGGGAVTIGAGVQAAYHGIYYHDYLRKKIFKNKGLDETIEYIKKQDSEAGKYADKLKKLEASVDKKIEVDGKMKTAAQLRAQIKEYEDIVYHGLKYIYEVGLESSDRVAFHLANDVEALLSKTSRTADEQTKVKNYRSNLEILGKIRDCTKTIVGHDRFIPKSADDKVFNPYKGLISKYIQKGCMLAEEKSDNGDIRRIKGSPDASEQAVKMYHQLFEAGLTAEEPKIDLAQKYELILQKADKYKSSSSKIQTQIDALNTAITDNNEADAEKAYIELDKLFTNIDNQKGKTLGEKLEKAKDLAGKLKREYDMFISSSRYKRFLEPIDTEKNVLTNAYNKVNDQLGKSPIKVGDLGDASTRLETELVRAKRKTLVRYYLDEKATIPDTFATTDAEKDAFKKLTGKDKDDLTSDEQSELKDALDVAKKVLARYHNATRANNTKILNNAESAMNDAKDLGIEVLALEGLINADPKDYAKIATKTGELRTKIAEVSTNKGTDEADRKNVKEYTDLRDALGKVPKDYAEIETKTGELRTKIAEVSTNKGIEQGKTEGTNAEIVKRAEEVKTKFEGLVTDEAEREKVEAYTKLRDALGKDSKDPEDYKDIETKAAQLEERIAEINKEAGKTEGLAEGETKGKNAEIVKIAKEAVKFVEDSIKEADRSKVDGYADLTTALKDFDDSKSVDYKKMAEDAEKVLGWLANKLGYTTSYLATSQQRVSDLEGKIRQKDAALNSALDKNSEQTLKAAEDAYNEAKKLKLGDNEAVKKLKAAIDEINGDLNSEKIKDLPSLTERVGELNKDNRVAVKELKKVASRLGNTRAELGRLRAERNAADDENRKERASGKVMTKRLSAATARSQQAEEERDQARAEAAGVRRTLGKVVVQRNQGDARVAELEKKLGAAEDARDAAQGAAYDEREARKVAEEEGDRARAEAEDLGIRVDRLIDGVDAIEQELYRALGQIRDYEAAGIAKKEKADKGLAIRRLRTKVFIVLNHIDQVGKDDKYNADPQIIIDMADISKYIDNLVAEYDIIKDDKALKLKELDISAIEALYKTLNEKYERASGYDPKTKKYSKWPNYNPPKVTTTTTNARAVYGANTTIGG